NKECLYKDFVSSDGTRCYDRCFGSTAQNTFNLDYEVCYCNSSTNQMLSTGNDGMCICKPGYFYSEVRKICVEHCEKLEKIEISQNSTEKKCVCDPMKNAESDDDLEKCVCKKSYHLNSNGQCAADSISTTDIVVYSLLGAFILILIIILIVVIFVSTNKRDEQVANQFYQELKKSDINEPDFIADVEPESREDSSRNDE
ncbi:MAG: hypothetical protein MHPSP_001595, partial [Paramarteilia canceri]